MKAAVWKEINKVEVCEVPDPKVQKDGVIVKVHGVGVCATDVHMIAGNVTLAKPPHILGHEIAGEIIEIGENVTGWKIGDRVVVDTIVSCGHCKACKMGRRELCSQREEIGYPPYSGGYAEKVAIPAQCLVKMPDSLSYKEGAILESIACPFGSVLRIGIPTGATVFVQGGGPAGISYIQAAKINGAGKIIASVRGKERIEYAKHFGADVVIDAEHENVLERVMEETDGVGCQVVMDAAGSVDSIMLCFDASAVGADVFFYGIPSKDAKIEFPYMKMMMKQLRLHGVLEYCIGWDTLAKMAGSKKVNVTDMVTHTFTLEQLPDAVELVKSKNRSLIKAVILM